MRILKTVVLLVAALAMMGCSSVTVNHVYDTQADFTAYKTYAWIEQPTMGVGSAETAQRMNTLLDKLVKSDVEAQLATKGMTLAAENPDALLIYHTGIDQKIEVQEYGYTYPHYGYGGWYYGGAYGGTTMDVYEYKEGTLIVDVIDAKTDQLVWRGTATRALEETAAIEKRKANLNEVITKLFVNYPPK